MRFPFLDFLGVETERLKPVENQMAKRWVMERLKRLFPDLRADPEALERAYQQLGLETRPGSGKGCGVVYEVTLPKDRSAI